MKNKIFIFLCILGLIYSCSPVTSKKEEKKDNDTKIKIDSTSLSTKEIKDTIIEKDIYKNISKDFLLGRYEPKNDTNCTIIDDPYCDRANMYINKETYTAYKKMYDAAQKDGIKLTIVSSIRNFNSQKRIWDRKWNKFSGTDSAKVKKIMLYSSMPGTSRHHWGSDMDLISVETEYWEHGYGLKAYQWLKKNAIKFGFFQPYTDDPNRGGYCEERWHWSYAPLSEKFLKAYEMYITEDDIYGFDGSEYAKKFGVIKTHVMGITPKEGYKK